MADQIFRQVSLATNNLARIKQIGANVKGWNIINTNAAVRYVKLWFFLPGRANKDVPVPGTDAPDLTIACAASGPTVFSAPDGITGKGDLWMATVTGVADNDNTSVGAGDLISQIYYE